MGNIVREGTIGSLNAAEAKYRDDTKLIKKVLNTILISTEAAFNSRPNTPITGSD